MTVPNKRESEEKAYKEKVEKEHEESKGDLCFLGYLILFCLAGGVYERFMESRGVEGTEALTILVGGIAFIAFTGFALFLGISWFVKRVRTYFRTKKELKIIKRGS